MRVLLVDDSELVRRAYGDYLTSVGFEVRLAARAEEALQHARESAYDVVLSDISMPGMDGITATTAILRGNQGARIVLVSVNADRSLVRCGLAAGALGYVLKLAAGDDLLPAVRAALLGQRHVSETLGFTG